LLGVGFEKPEGEKARPTVKDVLENSTGLGESTKDNAYEKKKKRGPLLTTTKENLKTAGRTTSEEGPSPEKEKGKKKTNPTQETEKKEKIAKNKRVLKETSKSSITERKSQRALEKKSLNVNQKGKTRVGPERKRTNPYQLQEPEAGRPFPATATSPRRQMEKVH